jgi:hypothetical protein
MPKCTRSIPSRFAAVDHPDHGSDSRAQQQHVDKQKEADPTEILGGDPVGKGRRNILVAENKRKQHGVGHDIEQHRACVRRPKQNARYVLESERLVHEHRYEK